MYKIVYTLILLHHPPPLLCDLNAKRKRKKKRSHNSLYKDLPRSRTGPLVIDLNDSAVSIELVQPMWLTCASVTSARAVSV